MLTHWKRRSPAPSYFRRIPRRRPKWSAFLNRRKIPFIPRGAGTGLSGGATPRGGEVIISLARMNRLLSVDLPNRIAVVQPGYINLHLTKALADRGFTTPPTRPARGPAPSAGTWATNSGVRTLLKYGVTANHVLGVELVLPDG